MRRLLVVMTIASALFAFCLAGASAQTLTVGTDAAYKPFEFIDEQGEFQGFDIDLIRAIGEAMGMEVVLINTAWDGIIPGLINGDYDVIISAMTITPERAESVDFSDPYFDAGQSILVRKERTDIQGRDDLIGKTVAVQIGTTGDLAVSEVEGIKVSRFNLMPEAFQELLNGAADAVVGDNATVIDFAAQNPDLVTVIGEPFTEEQYGIAIRKGNKELLAKVNAALAQIRADGTYQTIFDKWFSE
ncbi:MAG: basic amino acid ABC transporter substrate-binding protein [Firmicutes bacterium]|jgi:polar amino acid transport system substrate-binding protein|nr:basic amino acid ABC transporter substrate-binding protein [Bacillota bacterium]